MHNYIFLCSGPDLNTVTNVLQTVVTWRKLSSELKLKNINSIDSNCRLELDSYYCCRRELVVSYCSSLTDEEIPQVPCNIASALDRIEWKGEADDLRAKFPTAKCSPPDPNIPRESMYNYTVCIKHEYVYVCELLEAANNLTLIYLCTCTQTLSDKLYILVFRL